ncbi:GNAT family N-acetyltransferase [Colwelliaceae bacterium 6471]
MESISTERLTLRPVELDDAPTILTLFNEPDCIKFIGDKNLQTIEDAQQYIIGGPQSSYKKHGLGLLAVCLHSGEMIGLCGLLKREELTFPDLGYAILSNHYRKGYAKESCQAVLSCFIEEKSILALTHPGNKGSQSLLLQLGFTFDGIVEDINKDTFSNQYILNR